VGSTRHSRRTPCPTMPVAPNTMTFTRTILGPIGPAPAHRLIDMEVRVVVVPPGRARAYDAAEWRDALVLVAGGRIELRGAGGGRLSFAAGAALSLDGLTLRELHNLGPDPAVLLAISR